MPLVNMIKAIDRQSDSEGEGGRRWEKEKRKQDIAGYMTGPLLRQFGTRKAVKARFWP